MKLLLGWVMAVADLGGGSWGCNPPTPIILYTQPCMLFRLLTYIQKHVEFVPGWLSFDCVALRRVAFSVVRS